MGSLPFRGSVLTIVQPLQLDEYLKKTLSAKTTFDMTTSDLLESCLPWKDDDNGNNALSDSGSVSRQPFDNTHHQSQSDILCDSGLDSLQSIGTADHSQPGSELEAGGAKPIDATPKSTMTELQHLGYLANNSTQYIEQFSNGFSGTGTTHSFPNVFTPWSTGMYAAQADEYDDFSLCSQEDQ